MSGIYPSNFPSPMIEGYTIEVDMGLVRTEFESGFNRQRRRFETIPQYFSIKFTVSIEELNAWLLWINTNAYTWFEINALSYLGVNGCTPNNLRFISNLNIGALTNKYVEVSVNAELAPIDPANL